jgi:hypothetical protein
MYSNMAILPDVRLAFMLIFLFAVMEFYSKTQGAIKASALSGTHQRII